MKKFHLTSLITISLLLCGCNTNKKSPTSYSSSESDPSSSVEPSSSEPSEEPVPEGKVRFHIPASLNSTISEYTFDLDYDFTLFNNDARGYNKDLAVLSFGSALTNQNKELMKGFFDNMHFDNQYACEYYDSKPTEDSIGYYIAHKQLDDCELIAISMRGWNYEKEWSSNLKVGTSGNHVGFDESAMIVYNKLKEYISASYSTNKLKLWINGYSRAGGVSNVLASKILSLGEISVEQKDMFVYTFEAPRGLTSENAIAYENVFNLVNAPDIVPKIAPAEYGLYRCGVDINTYVSNVDEVVQQFDSNITLPTFKPYEPIDEEDPILFANETQFSDYLISSLLREDPNWIDDNQGWTIENTAMNTRERFCNNYQESIRYLLAMFFSLSSESVSELMESLSSLSAIISLVSEDGLYNLVLPKIQKDEIPYDDDKLKASCNALVPKLPLTVGNKLVGYAMGDYKDNFSRMINMHMPEVNLALINNYQPEP